MTTTLRNRGRVSFSAGKTKFKGCSFPDRRRLFIFVCFSLIMALRDLRNLLLTSHGDGLIDDDELIVLYDLYSSKNPGFVLDRWSFLTNRLHRTQCEHACLNTPSLVIWTPRHDLLSHEIKLTQITALERERQFDLRSNSPALVLPNLWLVLAITITKVLAFFTKGGEYWAETVFCLCFSSSKKKTERKLNH